MASYPIFLKEGDEVRIVSPAGKIDASLIDGAKEQLTYWGYNPTEGMFTRTVYGRFAGNEQERMTDLQMALNDENVKAILCSRGGYGLAQIIDKLKFDEFRKHPKWIIGFSDITVLHAAVNKNGFVSVHSSMAKDLTNLDNDAETLTILNNILKGKMPTYNTQPNKLNRLGSSKGTLIGGNLSVFMGLRSTPLEPSYKGAVLFIEDVGEEPYKVDRMMQNLRLSGALEQLSGLVVGQFTGADEDPDMHATVYEIIANSVKDYDYPVCFNFSAGHIEENFPLLMGATTTLDVTENGAKLSFQSTFWKKAKDFLKK